ncbi:hypothetical protein [Lacinutrix jangbogonensis]|uniref:hypothetical protein n=1 Tax=Lacinutrix jangbogonensis TaxID=1469557 RepID=UPI00053DDD13|nr:hypothetical protein [Lacinutrix jangbogonensis]
MAIKTNGWDYIYNIKTDKLNTSLSDINNNPNFKSLIQNISFNDVANTKAVELVVKSFEILPESDYPYLHSVMGLDGKYGADSFTGLKVKIIIDINWLNRTGNNILTTTATDVVMDSTLISAGTLTPFVIVAFTNVLQNLFNHNNTTVATDITDRHYDKYYKLFAGLNKFSVATPWMTTTTQTFSVRRNVHKALGTENCIFSFCCMINNNQNNDIGYVDINSIPKGATSALVIERSVFAEKMVMPELIKNFKYKGSKASILQFDKNGAYSYKNKKELILKSSDFITKKPEDNKGKISDSKLLINVEQDRILLSMFQVEYKYDDDTLVGIDQVYTCKVSGKSELDVQVLEKSFSITPRYKDEVANYRDIFTRNLVSIGFITSAIGNGIIDNIFDLPWEKIGSASYGVGRGMKFYYSKLLQRNRTSPDDHQSDVAHSSGSEMVNQSSDNLLLETISDLNELQILNEVKTVTELIYRKSGVSISLDTEIKTSVNEHRIVTLDFLITHNTTRNRSHTLSDISFKKTWPLYEIFNIEIYQEENNIAVNQDNFHVEMCSKRGNAMKVFTDIFIKSVCSYLIKDIDKIKDCVELNVESFKEKFKSKEDAISLIKTRLNEIEKNGINSYGKNIKEIIKRPVTFVGKAGLDLFLSTNSAVLSINESNRIYNFKETVKKSKSDSDSPDTTVKLLKQELEKMILPKPANLEYTNIELNDSFRIAFKEK